MSDQPSSRSRGTTAWQASDEVRGQIPDFRETAVVRLPARSSHCLVRSNDEDTNLVPFSLVVMGNDGFVGDEWDVDRKGAVHF